MINERLHEILNATVREYIKTGEPVSSMRLYEDYEFGIKPARIRAILNELSDSGFLFQTHTSGGRVPTDKALELFVGAVFEDLERARISARLHEELVREFQKGAFADFIHAMSQELELLGVGYAPKLGNLYASGLDELVGDVDVSDKSELREIIKDFERLEERIEGWMSGGGREAREVQVFIGKKSPITKSPHLAVMAELVGEGDDNMLLMAIGSRRMDYQKNLKFFKAIRELFN